MAVDIVTKEDLQVFKKELLSELKAVLGTVQATDKKYLQSGQVRKFLGISPGTLQHLRVTEQLPYVKIGGKIFYEMADIERMMNENKRK
ncbi:MAG: helix-turn-helix domain-containing protein [Spirosomaceae bacterium]|jgi:hypothetical protein|nr:helix-turn-helix domain-containing protein [Spirosomataceae bacterium]